jgi:hypothetical protein
MGVLPHLTPWGAYFTPIVILIFRQELAKDFNEDPEKAVELGYKMALGRSPSHSEKQQLLSYLQECKECNSSMAGAERLAWFLINLDEFIFLR